MKTLLKFSLLSFYITFSQVGIGTTSPNAAFDISQINNDGILIPNVSLDETDLTDITLSAYDYSTGRTASNGLLVYNTNATSPLKEGFYFWNGSIWSNIGNGWQYSGSNIGNSGARDFQRSTHTKRNEFPVNFIGTTNNEDIVFVRNGLEMMRIAAGEKHISDTDGTPPGNSFRTTLERFGLEFGSYQNGTALEASFNCDVEIGGWDLMDNGNNLFDGNSEILTMRSQSNKWQIHSENDTNQGDSDFYITSNYSGGFLTDNLSNPTVKINSKLLIQNDTGNFGVLESNPSQSIHLTKNQDATTALRIENNDATSSKLHTSIQFNNGTTNDAEIGLDNNTGDFEINTNRVKLNNLLNLNPQSSNPSGTFQNGDIYLFNDGTTRELRVYDSGTTTWYPL